MKTLREIFTEAEPDKVADVLLEKHLHTLIEQASLNETIMNVREICRAWTLRIISYLADAPKTDKHSCVFFAVPAAEDGSYWIRYGSIETVMCDIEELMADEAYMTTYGWLDQPYATLAGSYFAETLLTTHHLHEVLADILWEATWHGETDEERMRALENMGDAKTEDEDDDEDPELEKQWKAEWETYRRTCEMLHDSAADALKQKCDQAQNDYYEYCFKRELEIVREMLK